MLPSSPPSPLLAPEFVEVDPSGRYGRYDEILGKGATKTVYRAFDEYEGIEVAWNQVRLRDFFQSPECLERLYSEIHLLKALNHKNIMKFYTSWVDASNRNLNFVTEMFTSGTLRQYRHKYRRVSMRAVKHWCRQILEGLLYLHSLDPPVIHRDLKCDNIFVNGNQGEVKIGDLGLAAILRTSPAAHCVGTPEFMAPEVYEEQYNELVDIYSFGMCVLEMVTFEYPYSECNHSIQIYKKVTSGTKPEAFYKVQNPEVRRFVEKCLSTVSHRLPASELLTDTFLRIDEDLSPSSKEMLEFANSGLDLFRMLPSLNSQASNVYPMANELYDDILPEIEDVSEYDNVEAAQSGIETFSAKEDEKSPDLEITVKGRRIEDGSIFLRLRINEKDQAQNVYFHFNTEVDTALTVATEMVAQLEYLANFDVMYIAEMIDGELLSLMPEWRPGLGIEQTPGLSASANCQDCASTISSGGYTNGHLNLNEPNSICLGRYLYDEVEGSSNEGAASPSAKFNGSGVCPLLSKENNAPIKSKRTSFRKNKGTSLKKSSTRKSRGRFLCGSFHKVSVDLSEEGSLHPCPNALKEHETEIQQQLRWLRSKQQIQLREYQSSSNAGTLVPPDSQEGISACIRAKNISEFSLSNRRPKEDGAIGSPWQSCPNEDSRGVESCKAKSGKSLAHVFTARRLYMSILLPGCFPHTKSFKVDAINQ